MVEVDGVSMAIDATSVDAAPEYDCTPGEIVCATPLAIGTCASDGFSWHETACPEGYGCAGADCVAQTCTPGASSGECLDDDSYEQCNASGTAVEVIYCGQDLQGLRPASAV
jgi:hypothetical protein